MENNEVLIKAYESLIKKPENHIETGFSDIDLMFKNVEKNNLILLGARPAMGKTTLMTTILENLLNKGKKCLYFSLEMSERQFMQKFLTQCAEVSRCHLLDDCMNKKDFDKLTHAFEKIKEYNLAVCDDKNSVEEIEEKIKEFNPEYVFIDYLQLVQIPAKKQRHEIIAENLKKLKTVAKENNICIFITSQLSRAAEERYDKRPLLSDLRESGAIEEVIDVILFLYREEYYNPDNACCNKLADIIIAKNRFGPTGILNLRFEASIPKFYEPFGRNEF